MAFPRTATMPNKPQITLKVMQEEIRKRAQLIFDERSRRGLSGNELSDWLKAEKEVKTQYGI